MCGKSTPLSVGVSVEIVIPNLEKEFAGLKRFYDYWAELYGTGLEIANWHLNGDTEPFDNFFDSAEQEINT